MIDQQLLGSLVRREDEVVPALFKPVQFSVIRKLSSGARLNENEKRYLRGNIRKKLIALQQLCVEETTLIQTVLDSVGQYYITGLEALKHNGFGWYYDTRIIEVINTRISGKIRLLDQSLRFIRVKTIRNSSFRVDRLRYATNEQILKDISLTKNSYAERIWHNMRSRYGRLFVKGGEAAEVKIDFSRYGV